MEGLIASVTEFNENILTVCRQAGEIYGGRVQRLTVDPQESGEAPYQVLLVGDDLPLAGMAVGEVLPELGRASSAPKPSNRGR